MRHRSEYDDDEIYSARRASNDNYEFQSHRTLRL